MTSTSTTDVDAIVARLAPEPAPAPGEGARDLMHQIMATSPAPAARRRVTLPRLRTAVSTIALAGVTVVALNSVVPSGTGPAVAQALDIKREAGYHVIKINDLYADPGKYEAQLRAAGLDISLRVVPATAAFEGQVQPTGPDKKYLTEIKGIYPPGPCDRLDGCAIGVKIPVGFQGTADVTVGRKARPGEEYMSITSIDAKGEPLHCVPHVNKTVGEMRALLREREVNIGKFVIEDPGDDRDGETVASVPGSWHVIGGYMYAPGLATVVTSSTAMAPEEAEAAQDKTVKRCDQSSLSPRE